MSPFLRQMLSQLRLGRLAKRRGECVPPLDDGSKEGKEGTDFGDVWLVSSSVDQADEFEYPSCATSEEAK